MIHGSSRITSNWLDDIFCFHDKVGPQGFKSLSSYQRINCPTLFDALLVTRQGKPVAVLVAAEDWEDYLRLKKEVEGIPNETLNLTENKEKEDTEASSLSE